MNIYCIGRNYAQHAKELGNEVPNSIVVFTKTDIALRGFQSSEMAFQDETFHYEGELVLKIAKDHLLNESYSHESIEAIACGIDLTRRKEQMKLKEKGLPWFSSKSFLGSAIIGEFYEKEKFSNLQNLKFEFYVNNELKQRGNTKNMQFSFEQIINQLNCICPLKKGDLIMTGTPQGVGEIKRGDEFHFKINELNIEERGKL